MSSTPPDCLSKQHALEHLAADLSSYGVDVAIVIETRLGAKHADKIVSVPGTRCISETDLHGIPVVFRVDLSRGCIRPLHCPSSKGSGVAVYIRSSLQSPVWKYSHDDTTFELLWVRSASMFIGSLYNPPKPEYQPQAFVPYVDG